MVLDTLRERLAAFNPGLSHQCFLSSPSLSFALKRGRLAGAETEGLVVGKIKSKIAKKESLSSQIGYFSR